MADQHSITNTKGVKNLLLELISWLDSDSLSTTPRRVGAIHCHNYSPDYQTALRGEVFFKILDKYLKKDLIIPHTLRKY